MIANLFKRTLTLFLLIFAFLVFDAYLYSSRYLLSEVVDSNPVERTYVDAFKYLIQNRDVSPQNSRIKIGLRSYPIELDADGYPAITFKGKSYPVYEDEDRGQEYVDLDNSGNPSTEEGSEKAYAESLSHQDFFLRDSILLTFYIHYVLLAWWIIGLLKVFKGLFTSQNSKVVTAKSREKSAKKVLSRIDVLIKKGRHSELIETLTNPENRRLLHGEIEQFDINLGQSYLELGHNEKAVSVLKRYANRFSEDQEAKVILGEYFSKHRQSARIEDMPFLLAYLDKTEDIDFINWWLSLVMKYKLTDRKTIRGLVKVCSTEAGTSELREYVLEVLSEQKPSDEIGEEFYTSCKQLAPEDPRPRIMLAELKLSAGKFDEVLDELEELLNLDYENQRVHEMLYMIYDLKGQLNDLYLIYSNVLQEYPDEPIAVSQQRKIQTSPDFDSLRIDQDSNLSLAELLEKRKKGDAAAEQSILRKYEKFLTIMFTDIQGYTAMTESQSVVETMAILQESDDIISPLINKHEGEVIKKIGDAFMAKFESSESAITAAIQIQQAIQKNNDRREKDGKITWHIRIGLNTGHVIVKDGDVFGDAVNVASRVESLALVDGVFCTASTKDDVTSDRFTFIRHQAKKMKGKLEAMDLFSVVFDARG